MADLLVRDPVDLTDMSLVKCLWENQLGRPKWFWTRDTLGGALLLPGIDNRFLLTIVEAENGKPVAAVPFDDPLKVVVFDKSSLREVTQMLWQLKFGKKILVQVI